MPTIRTIFSLCAIGGALAVASPAMAADDCGACDPPVGDVEYVQPSSDQEPERVVPADEGDPPVGDVEFVKPASDSDERVVPADEGDPPVGDVEFVKPASESDERVVQSDEGDPLPGGDPEPRSEAPAQIKMTAANVVHRDSFRRAGRHHHRHIARKAARR